MLESDVYRRQILKYKDGPRADRVNCSTLYCLLSVLSLVALAYGLHKSFIRASKKILFKTFTTQDVYFSHFKRTSLL